MNVFLASDPRRETSEDDDDRIENLQKMNGREHVRLHGLGEIGDNGIAPGISGWPILKLF